MESESAALESVDRENCEECRLSCDRPREEDGDPDRYELMPSSPDEADEIAPSISESSGTLGIGLGVEAEPLARLDGPGLLSEPEEVEPISSALRVVLAGADVGAELSARLAWEAVDLPRFK